MHSTTTATTTVRPALFRPVLTACVTLAAAASAAVTAPATADVTVAEWNSSTDFNYHVNWMPDLDQRRVGLPNSGNMYCIPTSVMNMLAYAAQWGFEDMDPGPGSWTGYDDYYDMTWMIEDLGEDMGTSADGGTGGSGKRDGLDGWIDGYPLVADYVWRSGNECPSLSDIIQAVDGGHIAQISYGRYDWEWGFQGIIRLLDRTGGHGVTLQHASSEGFFNEVLWTRDPADDNPVDTFGQSDFSYRIYDDVETRTDLLHDLDEDGVWNYLDDGTLLNFSGNPDSQIRMIDSYAVLRPLAGYSYTHVQIAFPSVGGGGWIQNTPNPTHVPIAGAQIFQVAPAVGFQDLFVHAGVPGGPSMVFEASPRRGIWSDPHEPGFPVVSLATGVSNDLFLFGPERIQRVDQDRLSNVLGAASSPCPLDTGCFDDAGRRVLAISDDCDVLLAWDEDLPASHGPQMFVLPSEVPSAPAIAMTVCPETGRVICLFKDDNRAFALTFQADGSLKADVIGHPDVIDPLSVVCDDRGIVIISDGEKLHTFRETTAGYVKFEDPWYVAADVQGPFQVDRSRTNYDAAEHDTPGWNTNIDPADLEDDGTTVADCLADFDGDGQVGFTDLVGLLEKWGGDSSVHDIAPFGGDDLVDLADLLAVLAAWGPCEG